MRADRRGRGLVCVFACVASLVPACRDIQPPPPHDRDLGDDGALLLPTASVWNDPGIANGRADWHPFREPSLDEGAGSDSLGSAQTDADGSAAGSNRQVETQVRAMIDDYNDFVAEATVDDLLDYYIEEQHNTLKLLFEKANTLTESFAAIRKELETKLPDALDRIDAALGALEANAGPMISVDSLTVVSATEVTGTAAIGPAFRFRLIDEDWYIELVGLGDFAELKPAIDAGMAKYNGLLVGLQTGQMSPQTVLQQVEAEAQGARARLGLDTSAGDNTAAQADDE